MEELLNFFIELYQWVVFSRFINEKKPYARYAEEARKLTYYEGRILIDSLQEKDWMRSKSDANPAFILFKGKNQFSPYVLDDNFCFISRLYKISKPEAFKSANSLLVELKV